MKPRCAVDLYGNTVAALVEFGAVCGMSQVMCTSLTGTRWRLSGWPLSWRCSRSRWLCWTAGCWRRSGGRCLCWTAGWWCICWAHIAFNSVSMVTPVVLCGEVLSIRTPFKLTSTVPTVIVLCAVQGVGMEAIWSSRTKPRTFRDNSILLLLSHLIHKK